MCLYFTCFFWFYFVMNYFFVSCVLFSSLSFLIYSVLYFVSPNMKNQFKRFNLEKYGLIVIIFEILGALGLLVGFLFKPLLFISSGGLAALMLIALLVRMKSKDSLWVSIPSIFYLLLNAFIFYFGFSY